ncbi:MAG: hypothetical protein AAF352_09370, partial [Pseudomonadota bacterium]
MKAKHDYPYHIYHEKYFDGRSPWPIAFDIEFLRITDQFSALCYALERCASYREVEELLGIPGSSLLFGVPHWQSEAWRDANGLAENP